MSIRCQCTQCGATYKVADDALGKRIKCTKCATVFAVAPLAEVVAAPQAAVAPPVAPAVNVGVSVAQSISGAHRAPPKKSSQAPLFIGGGVLLAVLVGGGAYFALNQSPPPKKKPVVAKKETEAEKTPQPGKLLVDWTAGERAGGQLKLDGKPQPLSATAALSFSLPPGKHEVSLLRRGFEPFSATIEIAEGKEANVRPEWKSLDTVAAAPSPMPLARPTSAEPNRTPFVVPAERVTAKPFSVNRPAKPEPVPTVKELAPNVSQAFFDNPTAAKEKYGSPQVLQIEGDVVKYMDDPGRGGGWLRLQGSGNAMVDCFLEKHWTDYAKQLKPGDTVTVAAGNLYPRQGTKMLVNFDFCEFVGGEHRGEAPAVVEAPTDDEALAMPKDKDGRPLFTLYRESKPEFDVTAEQLAKEFIADPGSLYQKYVSNKMVRVTGVIHEIKVETRVVEAVVIYLRGAGDVLVEMEMSEAWKEFVKRYKPGDKVVMVGLSPARDFDKPKSVFVDAAEFPKDK